MKRTLRRSIVAPTAWIRARRKEPTMRKVVLLLAVGAALGAPGVANADTGCPPDSVKVGTACIDLYEASVWSIPAANTNLIAKVQAGTATLADLTGDGATQLNPEYLSFPCSSNYPPNFPSDGNWTPILGSSPPSPGVYAVSVAGVLPSTCTTWFQAVQACAVSGKRLVRNEEWQRAAAGTPDPGTDNGTTDCNISTADHPVNTGSRANCKSSWGVFDMVGNVGEWVADWADQAQNCTDWTTQTGIPGGDIICFGDFGAGRAQVSHPGSHGIPAALIRGGQSVLSIGFAGSSAGVFSVDGLFFPSDFFPVLGFRCAR